MTIIASLAWATAAAMQKHGLNRNFPKITLKTFLSQFVSIVKTMAANWLWLSGILIGILGGLVYAQALSMGDLSMIQPLANTTILFTILIGVFLLNERLSKMEWSGLFILLSGAVLIGLSSSQETSVNPSSQALYGFAAVILLIAALILVVQRLARKLIPVELTLAVSAGFGFGLANVFLKVITFIAEQQLGQFNVLDAQTWRVILFTLPTLLVALLNVISFVLMQGAFAHGRVSLITPVTTIFSVLIPILAGLLIFQEQASALRLIGIVVIIPGAILLSGFGTEPQPD